MGDLDRDVLNIINVSSAVLVELKFIIMWVGYFFFTGIFRREGVRTAIYSERLAIVKTEGYLVYQMCPSSFVAQRKHWQV